VRTRVTLAVLVAVLAAVPAGSAYRNPTPGKAVILQLPGMHRAQVRRNVVFGRGGRLRMDVYRPRGARARLPAVLIGGPARRSGQAVGWAQLLSAGGLAAAAADLRSEADARAALAYLRAHSRALGIDAGRLCALGFSSRAAERLLGAATGAGPGLRCAVVYYGRLDAEPAQVPPLLVVKAVRDSTGIDESIDRFGVAAQARHADVRVVTVPGGHGFDVGLPTKRGRAVVKETLRFLAARLARPLPMSEGCATRAERRSVLRFFTSEDLPIAGVVVGSGPRGVVLAHASDEDLCSWLPYARQLASSGHRVLAFDSAPGVRVDLEVAAAVEAMRRTGSEHVIAAGASIGATGALIGSASLPSQPAAVVSLSAPASYGPLRALRAARRLHAPVFVAASAEDHPFAEDAAELYAASPSSDRRMEILPGSAHGERMLQDAAFRARVTAFIAAH
jgi:dienelactone hydrolase